jgi:hypothetical protein
MVESTAVTFRVDLFRSLRVRWAGTDGCIRIDTNESGRTLYGPEWEDNSCAADTLIKAALLANFLRARADQMLPGYIDGLRGGARALWYLCIGTWRDLHPDDRKNKKDKVIRALRGKGFKNCMFKWVSFWSASHLYIY